MGEAEVLIIKYLSQLSNTDALQGVQGIPEVAFYEISMHSLCHLWEAFLQLFKHLQLRGRLRKFNTHRQSRLTPERVLVVMIDWLVT